MSYRIPLDPHPAGPRRLLVDGQGFRLESFVFPSGVEALTIETATLALVVLPFTGQQVWRARAFDRELTMRSTFDEPVVTDRYLENNGAYFIHCGGSAMGNPGPGDEHPLHGELPNARLTSCELELDPAAGTVRLTGRMTHRVSFGAYFGAELSLLVHRDSAVLESTARLTNLSAEPRPLMYLAHINMRPAPGGAIEEDLEPTGRIVTRSDVTCTIAGVPRTFSAADVDAGAVTMSELLGHGVRVEPEIVQTVPSRVVDGWKTVRQRHPDGAVDVVTFTGDDLTHTLRWMRRSADDDACGFALPATAEADGFLAETAKGHVRWYGPGDSLVATIRHGAERPGEPAGHPDERTNHAH